MLTYPQLHMTLLSLSLTLRGGCLVANDQEYTCFNYTNALLCEKTHEYVENKMGGREIVEREEL